MLTPVFGIAILVLVAIVSMGSRSVSQLSFFDPHAAFVVVGGVIGALLIAIDRRSLGRMLVTVRDVLPIRKKLRLEIDEINAGIQVMRQAWREGHRGKILEFAGKANIPKELQIAADALLEQKARASIAETFTELRNEQTKRWVPVVEGWEMISRLAPSFGMVGTVTGMVQLFQNMHGDISSLGGAMGMALLATLYGIFIGAAVGGPMVTRVDHYLSTRLETLDFVEKTVLALVSENSSREAQSDSRG